DLPTFIARRHEPEAEIIEEKIGDVGKLDDAAVEHATSRHLVYARSFIGLHIPLPSFGVGFSINLEVLQRSGAREGFACRCEATTGTGHRAERDADASLGAGRIRRTLEDRLYVKIGSAQRKSAATGLPRRWTRSRPRLQSRIVAVPPSRPEGEHVSLVHRVSLSLPPHHARRPPRGHV